MADMCVLFRFQFGFASRLSILLGINYHECMIYIHPYMYAWKDLCKRLFGLLFDFLNGIEARRTKAHAMHFLNGQVEIGQHVTLGCQQKSLEIILERLIIDHPIRC